jgi:putative endonuclease
MFYIGFTSDLKRRIKEHLASGAQTTSRMGDIKLVYYEACTNEKDAREREISLKTGFGRRYIKNRLKNYLEE